jgi:hypothetical protein
MSNTEPTKSPEVNSDEQHGTHQISGGQLRRATLNPPILRSSTQMSNTEPTKSPAHLSCPPDIWWVPCCSSELTSGDLVGSVLLI